MKLVIAHSVAIGLKVSLTLAGLFNREVTRKGGEYRIKLPSLQFRTTLVRPVLRQVSSGPVESLPDRREALVRVLAIHDLESFGK